MMCIVPKFFWGNLWVFCYAGAVVFIYAGAMVLFKEGGDDGVADEEFGLGDAEAIAIVQKGVGFY